MLKVSVSLDLNPANPKFALKVSIVDRARKFTGSWWEKFNLIALEGDKNEGGWKESGRG